LQFYLSQYICKGKTSYNFLSLPVSKTAAAGGSLVRFSTWEEESHHKFIGGNAVRKRTMTVRSKILLLALLIEGGACIVALVLARAWGIPLFPLTKHLLLDIAMGTIAALIPFALFIFSLSEKAKAISLLSSLRKIVEVRIRPLFASATFFDICLISLCAGVAEELLFRGVIQVKGGIVVASILFGVLHWVTPAYALLATAIGFYIGLVYHFTQSLLIPIQLHCLYDFGALLYLRYCAKDS
jgi:membrane protease YdiL (CAAX protease family)